MLDITPVTTTIQHLIAAGMTELPDRSTPLANLPGSHPAIACASASASSALTSTV